VQEIHAEVAKILSSDGVSFLEHDS
jgi:hypothetical protein